MKGWLAFFKGRRVLVTGDTGFKGSWLSFWLHHLGAHVTGYALPPKDPGDLFNRLQLARRIRHIHGDIRDRAHLKKVFAGFRPEIVFHLAAQSLVRLSYADPTYTVETNVAGSANLLDSVRQTPSVRSLVFITSDKCYLNKEARRAYRENDELGGHDPYSASKAAAELVFASFKRSFFDLEKRRGVASVRAGNVIGGGDWATDRLVPDCIRALQKDRSIEIRHPAAIRPWQHVLDPLYGYLMLAERLHEHPREFSGSWNFGPSTHSVRTVREVVSTFIAHWGRGTLRHISQNHAPHESQLLMLNCNKARRLLGWVPLWNVDRSIVETVNWYRAVHAGEPAAEVTQRQLVAYMESRS